MFISIKKLIFTLYLNISLVVALIIVIQNSSNKYKVNLFLKDSIELPLSFVIGSSFICGSFTSGLMNVILKE
tara:strand:+ start:442 stop:657 length:216 start_codon:yes stop_codon:yes gene_type:complete